MTLTAELKSALLQISTATVTTVLLKKGLRRSYMRGPMPYSGGEEKIVGEAFTLRFVPMREDLATPESWASPISTRAAIEAMPEGCIAIADAMGVRDAGIFGDILAERMKVRGVTGLVTDGVMRDGAGVRSTHLPIWCAGVAAPASVAGLTFVGWNEPIACGGTAVFPGDVIMADGDGVVVIPKAMAAAVAEAGLEQELFEGWAHMEVRNGAALPGLYPPNDATKARYQEWRTKRG